MDQEQIKTLKISNDLGLHGRAAAKIVEIANQYKSRLFFRKDGLEIDASSILSILTLACQKGTEIQARAVGEDSGELIASLCTLFNNKFGENK